MLTISGLTLFIIFLFYLFLDFCSQCVDDVVEPVDSKTLSETTTDQSEELTSTQVTIGNNDLTEGNVGAGDASSPDPIEKPQLVDDKITQNNSGMFKFFLSKSTQLHFFNGILSRYNF